MTLAEQIKQVMEYETNRISAATIHYQDIIRQLTDIVKVQHEAIAETQAARKATREHGKDATHRLRASAARKRIKALAISAPIVKEIV